MSQNFKAKLVMAVGNSENGKPSVNFFIAKSGFDRVNLERKPGDECHVVKREFDSEAEMFMEIASVYSGFITEQILEAIKERLEA